MTLYQFIAADEMKQIEAFWDGVLIGERMDGEYKIECRQIDGFYSEYKSKDKFYADMRAFKNPDLLASYLDSMDSFEMPKF